MRSCEQTLNYENVIRQPLDCQPECRRRKFIACVACVSELCRDGDPSHHYPRPYVVTHNDSVSRFAGDALGGGDGNERAYHESDGTFAGRPNILSNARCIADASIYRHTDDRCDSDAIADGNSVSDSVGDIDSGPCADTPPSPTATATSTSTPTLTPSPTVTPSSTPSPTWTPTVTSTATVTPTPVIDRDRL